MASSVSDYGAGALLCQMFGVSPVPAGYWIALCLSEPDSTADGDVLVGVEPPPMTGYSRQWIATGFNAWTLNGAQLTNVAEVDYGVPGADWGSLTHYALTDDQFSGNLIAYGEFLSPVAAGPLYQMTIPPGGLNLALYALENTIAL